ncbi:MAG: hypothetical protein O2894_02315 [Planctomycetota bacterium]|nr:hypothetical protein [Planctomycetota bacterium]
MHTTVLRRSALILGLALAAWAASPATAADKESRERWMLTFSHGPLRTVTVRNAGSAATYHYMTIKVANETKHTRSWHPLVKALTDTKKTYVAGGYADALEEIRRAEKSKNIVLIGTTAGRLPAGTSHETVAIFGAVDPLYDNITVQIFGLVDPTATYKVEQYGDKSSGDTVVLGAGSVVVDSAYWDHNQGILKRLKAAAKESGGEIAKPSVEYQEVSENRYWNMEYQRLGDEFRAEDDIITFHGEGWRVAGGVGAEGGPAGLRVISREE